MDAIIIWLIQTTNTNTGDGGGAAQRVSLEEGESIPPSQPSPIPPLLRHPSLGSISPLFIFFSNSSFKSTLQRCEVKHMAAAAS